MCIDRVKLFERQIQRPLGISYYGPLGTELGMMRLGNKTVLSENPSYAVLHDSSKDLTTKAADAPPPGKLVGPFLLRIAVPRMILGEYLANGNNKQMTHA